VDKPYKMHEFSIAQNIITIVEEELAKQKELRPVRKIFFHTGRLNAVIPETLRFGFDIQKQEKPLLARAILEIKEIPIKIRCRNCGKETELEEPAFLCPECASQQIEVITGKHMTIDSIELE